MADERPIRREDWAAFFGPLYKFLIDDGITDIDCTGQAVVIGTAENVRQRAEGTALEEGFTEALAKRIANSVSRPFDREHPVLEAGIESLRITAVHPAASEGGGILSIRKALPRLRLSEETAVRDGFCSEEVLALLKAFVEAGMSICIAGEPGAGKTECARFLSSFIPEGERVVTIEEAAEWHYGELAPGRDAAALIAGPGMDYAKALRTALHLNPSRLLFSEIRGGEVRLFLDALSSGIRGAITTVHTDDVKNIPARLTRLAGSRGGGDHFMNDVYTFLDAGIRVRKRTVLCADGTLRTIRSVDQAGIFTREEGKNVCTTLVEDGKMVRGPLPEPVQEALDRVKGQIYPKEEVFGREKVIPAEEREKKAAEAPEEEQSVLSLPAEEELSGIPGADTEDEAIRFAADKITISTAGTDEQKAAEQERMEEIMTELFRLGKNGRTCLGSRNLAEGAASG